MKFKVISSNPNQNNGFVTKISNETKVNTFVGEKTKKTTYYISGSKQLTPDTEVDVNLDFFEVREYPFEIEGEVVMLKWLHVK